MPDAKPEITELSAVVQPATEEIPSSNVLLTRFVPRGKLRTRTRPQPQRRWRTRRSNFRPRKRNKKKKQPLPKN